MTIELANYQFYFVHSCNENKDTIHIYLNFDSQNKLNLWYCFGKCKINYCPYCGEKLIIPNDLIKNAEWIKKGLGLSDGLNEEEKQYRENIEKNASGLGEQLVKASVDFDPTLGINDFNGQSLQDPYFEKDRIPLAEELIKGFDKIKDND